MPQTPFLKRCSKCHKQKWNSSFSIKSNGNLRAECKECNNDYHYQKYNLQDPEQVFKYNLKYQYGITDTDYELMLKSQEEKCKICGQSETTKNNNGKIKRLSVDHDHKTGKIRGLLCDNCNNALGRFNDDIEILKAAITYLERNQDA